MRKSQAMELASVPSRVSVYTRRPADRHAHRFGRPQVPVAPRGCVTLMAAAPRTPGSDREVAARKNSYYPPLYSILSPRAITAFRGLQHCIN